MRIRITRISPASLALTLGILYGGIGICISLFSAIAGFIEIGRRGSVGPQGTESFGMLLLQPVLTTIAGLIAGFVIAWVYNFISRFTKGVIIDYTETGRHEEVASS